MKNILISSYRKKSNYIIFLILFVSTYLICGIFMNFFKNYTDEINNLKYDKRNYSLEANIDLNKKELILENNRNIEYYYSIFPNRIVKCNNGNITVNYYNYITTSVFKGNKIERENDIIISLVLYEKLGYENNTFGKKINLLIDNREYEFNIVGITKDQSSQVYLKLETFKEIFKVKETKYKISPKNYESYQKLVDQFSLNNINYELSDTTLLEKIDSIKNINYICIMFLILIIFIEYIFIAIIIKSMIRNEIKDIAILKALGYKISLIKKILLIRVLIIVAISYFVSIIIISCLSLIKISFIDIANTFNYYNIITFLIFIYVVFAINKYGRKIKKMNVMNVLEDM